MIVKTCRLSCEIYLYYVAIFTAKYASKVKFTTFIQLNDSFSTSNVIFNAYFAMNGVKSEMSLHMHHFWILLTSCNSAITTSDRNGNNFPFLHISKNEKKIRERAKWIFRSLLIPGAHCSKFMSLFFVWNTNNHWVCTYLIFIHEFIV